VTVEELLAREGIRDTMARYNSAGDRLRADDFVANFTEDGVLESDGVPAADAFRYVGRAAIRSWITRFATSATPGDGPRATFVRHHLSTSVIDLTGSDSAQARTYWTAITDIGPDHGGVYLDMFRKVGDRWLIAHRKVRMDWRAPGSLFLSTVARTRDSAS
jgi:hypothetical protein